MKGVSPAQPPQPPPLNLNRASVGPEIRSSPQADSAGGSAKPAEPSPKALDLRYVHQEHIPGIWNQVKMPTFPTSWVILGYDPGVETAERMFLRCLSYGTGAIRTSAFSEERALFCGFRLRACQHIAAAGDKERPPKAKELFAFLLYIGPRCPPGSVPGCFVHFGGALA